MTIASIIVIPLSRFRDGDQPTTRRTRTVSEAQIRPNQNSQTQHCQLHNDEARKNLVFAVCILFLLLFAHYVLVWSNSKRISDPIVYVRLQPYLYIYENTYI